MLVDRSWKYRPKESDEVVFDYLVADDHPLRLMQEAVNWDEFREVVNKYYCRDRGQPSYDPLMVLKLEFVRYLQNLSDRQVMERAKTDVAIRFFLGVGMRFSLPHPTVLTRFRGRLGSDGFHEVFQKLVGIAHQSGIVKDRLRLKDASHVIANVAVPTTLGLLAQLRDHLISAAAPFDPEGAEGHRLNADLIRERTEHADADEKLHARIAHVQDLLDWLEQLPVPNDASSSRPWNRLQKLKTLAGKILFEQTNPDATFRTISLVDPDACHGKHGKWYDGYTLDVMMDADSELITELNVLPGGGDEAKDAVELIRREESAHHNDIQALSMDGAGFNGAMLEELEDPNGLAVEVFVPPDKQREREVFSGKDFELTDDGSQVTCPAGQRSKYRQQGREHTTIFRFTRKQCDACPLVKQCMLHPGRGKFGKTIHKNRYEAAYKRARERAQTEEFTRVRKAHSAIERKLHEFLNHHRGRYARYWGRSKVLCQQYMIGFTVNLKRLTAILRAKRLATS